jgi:predicted nucleic acid-binding protein
MADALLDTNVFIHAQTTDQHSAECPRFIEALDRGDVQARLDPLVLHEISYTLPHYRKQLSRGDLATYLLWIISLPGVVADKGVLVDTVQRWRDTPKLAFVDAYVAALGTALGAPVFTKNVRELRNQGVVVPEPLPS